MIVGGRQVGWRRWRWRWWEVGWRGGEIFRVEYRDVDVFLTDMLDINLTLLIEHLILHHSEGDVAPEIVGRWGLSVCD